MYVKTPRNTDGTFKMAKKILESGSKCPPLIPVVIVAAGAVAIWEVAKSIFGD